MIEKIKVTSYEEFYRAVGVKGISATCGCADWTALRWKVKGIPLKFWEPLINKYGLSPDILYRWNKIIKGI